jgi:hypothetical protein
MARPKRLEEKTLVRFPRGTLERILAIVGKGNVAVFIREAAERELRRRERATARKPAKNNDAAR